MNDYKQCITHLSNFSKNSKVFILIHKMDKIPESEKLTVLEGKKAVIMEASKGAEVVDIFATSIWDESL